MKTYTYNDPELGRSDYVDHKRYLWMLSVLFPLIPLVGMGLMCWSGQEWTLWIPLVLSIPVIPLLDYLFPNDRSNPPEQVVPQLEADAYYRILNHLTVPLHFVILITGAWFVANHELGWSGLLALSLIVGRSAVSASIPGTNWVTRKTQLTAWLPGWCWPCRFTDTFRWSTMPATMPR